MVEQDKPEYKNLIQNLADYINTDSFFKELVITIAAVKKEETKSKLMLELMNYIYPKMKAREDDEVDPVESINILFNEAKQGNEDGQDS